MLQSAVAEPVVSIVMTFLNAEKFIREAIDSIIAQTYSAWELVLVDDGSGDSSTPIARSYAAAYPGQIRYLEHEGHRNCGMSASRNAGIRSCRGRYIAFLDADDMWLPHKLERQVALMESQSRAAMVYGASRYWYSWTGNPEDFGRDYVPDMGVPTEVLFDPPALLTRLYPFGPATTPPPSDWMVRREAVEAVGGFEEVFRGIYQLYEDQAFLVKMYLTGSIFVSSAQWLKYRIHPDSCDAATARAGHYGAIRAFFLRWFKSYLVKQKIRDREIWRMLQNAVEEARMQLRTDGGSVAQLLRTPNDPGGARIAIQKAATAISWDIQLNQPFYEVRANCRYTVVFKARSDNPRNLRVGVSAAHAPWTGVGMYRQIELTEEWQTFDLEFVATIDDDNARIHFDVGESEVSVELTGLFMRDLSNGRLIEPALPQIQIDQLPSLLTTSVLISDQ